MSEEKTPPGPFRIVSEVPKAPRPGASLVDLIGQILKRLQQTALMVDGFASAVNRRFDVLHEEIALLRVTMNRPVEERDNIDVTVSKTPAQKARGVVALTGRLLSYGTSLALLLRLVGKQFPEYEAAIDGLLGLFGL